MIKNKKQRKILLYLLVILGLTIGFALLSTTLKINGTAGVKSNNWDIHWDSNSINVTSGSIAAETPVVSDDGKNISYTVQLELPGDFYEFTVDAVNAGTIDGMISIAIANPTIKDSEGATTTLPEYINYSVKYADDTDIEQYHKLAKRKDASTPTRETYKIRIEYNSESTILPNSDSTYVIDSEIPYTQADDNAIDRNAKKLSVKTQSVAGELNNLDEVCIDSECFYVISSDSTKTVLLAKYNLYVGVIKESNSDNSVLIDTSSSDYGLQNSTAKGELEGEESYIGVVPFASREYWMHEDETTGYYVVNPKYTDGFVYDEELDSEPVWYHDTRLNKDRYILESGSNDDYSVAYYVKQYNTLLEGKGLSTIKSRILSKTEADSIRRNYPQIVDRLSWIGYADNTGSADFITRSAGSVFVSGTSLFDEATSIGVRPVIEVSTNDIDY